MSDDQGFEKWWSESPDAHRFSTAREKVVTYAAYQAGRESAEGKRCFSCEALHRFHIPPKDSQEAK